MMIKVHDRQWSTAFCKSLSGWWLCGFWFKFVEGSKHTEIGWR